MKKVKNKLQQYWDFWTAKDKLLHFTAGTIIYIITNWIFDPETAIGVTIAIGLLKEGVWDLVLGKGQPEMADFVMTIIPAFLLFFLF